MYNSVKQPDQQLPSFSSVTTARNVSKMVKNNENKNKTNDCRLIMRKSAMPPESPKDLALATAPTNTEPSCLRGSCSSHRKDISRVIIDFQTKSSTDKSCVNVASKAVFKTFVGAT
ncbi:hypothetical protein J6590_067262 [Homalodisca vitripennis]|nr:hypothetical protein J6590_067262 [Homalodisca vitripennis]